MRALVFASTALLGLLASGCDVGESGDGPAPPAEDQLALLCEATLTITGTFEQGGTPPAEGCSAEGTWTVQVAVDDPGDCDSVNINDEYVYVVTRDEEELLQVDYQGSDANPDADSYKPGSAGDTCRINSEHFSADEREIVYLRAFEDGTTLTGSGDYELWGDAPDES
jgi:hypothetical protein